MLAYRPQGVPGPLYAPTHSILTTLPQLLYEGLVDQQKFFDTLNISEDDVEKVRQTVLRYFKSILDQEVSSSPRKALTQAGWIKQKDSLEDKQKFYIILGACMPLIFRWYHQSLIDVGNEASDFIPFIYEVYQQMTEQP
jgi:hypothetical protein